MTTIECAPVSAQPEPEQKGPEEASFFERSQELVGQLQDLIPDGKGVVAAYADVDPVPNLYAPVNMSTNKNKAQGSFHTLKIDISDDDTIQWEYVIAHDSGVDVHRIDTSESGTEAVLDVYDKQLRLQNKNDVKNEHKEAVLSRIAEIFNHDETRKRFSLLEASKAQIEHELEEHRAGVSKTTMAENSLGEKFEREMNEFERERHIKELETRYERIGLTALSSISSE